MSSAQLASIFLSTSHSDTTSTGETWISRSRSHFPYQPVPMRPTRLFSAAKLRLGNELSARPARPAAEALRRVRRFMGVILRWKRFELVDWLFRMTRFLARRETRLRRRSRSYGIGDRGIISTTLNSAGALLQ